MGNAWSTPNVPPSRRPQEEQGEGEDARRPRSSSVDDCPVLTRNNKNTSTSTSTSTGVGVQYNVYNQRIDAGAMATTGATTRATTGQQYVLDPRNNMPVAANQAPFPGQKALLSTDRVDSNIPKGGTDGTWVYPSPQMFYNALKRRARGTTWRSGIWNLSCTRIIR